MALIKKVYGVRTPVSARTFAVHGVFDHHPKIRKSIAAQSEIGYFGRFELKLQFVSDQGNKFRIGRLALGIADGIAKESLQCIQVTSVPGYLNGMADGSLHTAGGGLEGLCHLGV